MADEDGGTDDFPCYGVATVNDNGQVTVPADARSEIGLEKNTRVIFFGDKPNCRLIVMAAPPGDEHLRFVTEQAAARAVQRPARRSPSRRRRRTV